MKSLRDQTEREIIRGLKNHFTTVLASTDKDLDYLLTELKSAGKKKGYEMKEKNNDELDNYISNDVAKYECPYCGKGYEDKIYYGDHVMKCVEDNNE